MKKTLLFIALAFCSRFATAQCTPDGSITEPGIYPDTLVNLPHAYGGVAYNTTIQVNVLTDTSSGPAPVTVDDITLDSVSGLPASFFYTCNPSNCVFPAGQTKCLYVYGNPTLAQAGTYTLIINVTLHGRAYGFIPVSQASQVLGYKIVIVGKPVPQFAGTPTTLCSGAYVTYSDQSTNEPATWAWSFPGGTPASSTLQIPPAIQYKKSGNKNITLTVTNPAGSNSLTKTAYIHVNKSPVATITPSGTVTMCSGASTLLTASTDAGYTHQWIKGTADISGATGLTYNATSGGNYKVRVTNTAGGCSKVSAVTVVSVAAVTATATANGPTTFCAGGSVTLSANGGVGLTYKWKKGANFISGATGINYVATTGGNYKVVVTNSNGCSKTSNTIAVTVNCREAGNIISEETDAVIYPNPTNAISNIDVNLVQADRISVKVIDVTGKFVAQIAEGNYTAGKHHFAFDTSVLSKGIYFAVINTGDKTKTLKMIVEKD